MAITFGMRLRNLRNAKKLKQEELAEKFNISKSSIGMYERDEREAPYELLDAFAAFFGVTADYLLGRSEQPHRTEREDIEDSLQTLKMIQKKFANNEVPGVSPERSQRTAEILEMQISKIEEELDNKNNE